jgi:phenazine biosynthesis protein phzE
MTMLAPRGPLDQILRPQPPPFALLHRPESGSPDCLDVFVGEAVLTTSLADAPLAGSASKGPGPAHDALVVIPYRQITERGYAAPDDGAPLITISITAECNMPVADALAAIPAIPTGLAHERFDLDDDAYAEMVRRVVANEIGTGEGANFVIKRSFLADISDYSPRSALSFFRRLLEQEHGAYWTFMIHAGRHTLVGASPERHITLNGGTAVMNPISGTYRYPPTGPTLQGVTDFLDDRKEADELYMVLDEELKMMARICDSGGRVTGPYLEEMTRLAHTGYLIEGQTSRDVREILRETMFAPTVTGSPLQNAARVIRRYEPGGRGYYSGVAALIGRDASEQPEIDSAILIRTAEIDPGGRVRISVGATLVRHSEPASEAAETRAKASGLLDALTADERARFGTHPEVLAALGRRNARISGFWSADTRMRQAEAPALAGKKALVVDAEDTFTAMLACELKSLKLEVDVCRFDEPYPFDGYDLVVMGPGPHDPRDDRDPKIARLRSATDALLAARRPFLAVCLSHQVLSSRLGLEVTPRAEPNQGVQHEIDLFGVRERVGFYNTFSATSTLDTWELDGRGLVEASRDKRTREVHALRGPGFGSLQFHAESVLTVNGPRILSAMIQGVLDQ